MASSPERECCTVIRDTFFCVHEANSKVRRLSIDIEEKNYKRTRCRHENTTDVNKLKEVLREILEVIRAISTQVAIHQGCPTDLEHSNIDQVSQPILVSDPCELGLEMLLGIKRDLKIQLANLEHHNDSKCGCDLIRECHFQPDEMARLVRHSCASFQELHRAVNEHTSYCPTPTSRKSKDSGICEGDDSVLPPLVNTQRHGKLIAQESSVKSDDTEADQEKTYVKEGF